MIKLCFSSSIWHHLCIWPVQFSWFLCSTNISTRACACVRVMWKSCVQCEENPTFWEFRGNVLGDDGKCLCLRAKAATFTGRQESVQQPDVVHSIHRATSVQWLESWVGRMLKAFHQPLAHKNRKDSFSEERLTEWLTEKNKKCVNKEQPF